MYVAHRLALAVIQAAKDVSLVERFKKQINSLFVFFHGSPKRQGRLKAAFSALEDRPSLKLQRPSDTRWLACNEAIQVVKKSLNPLLITLQEIANDDGDVTALGLATLLTSYKFVAGVFFMAETMPILAHLSKTFQIENIDYSSIRPAIERAKSSIGTLTSLSKSKTADWQIELGQWKEKSSEPLTGLDQDQFLACFALPFLSAVEKNLLERFPDQDVSILSAAVVLDPSSIPTSPAERYLHGRDNITTLATHYGCDVVDTLSEWKEVLLAALNFKKSREFLNFLVSHRSIYPNLGKISCSFW